MKLGRQYRLKVQGCDGSASVLLKGGYIQVSTSEKNQPLTARELLENWYRSRAKALFHEHMQRCQHKTVKHGIKDAPIRIQKMNSRWGSFTPSGTIILNLSLIKAPVQCIDYVIIHELCHTKIRCHGPDFEHLLTRCLPDWRKRKARLEQTVIT
jgi:predicted metal-dependent hydrolase